MHISEDSGQFQRRNYNINVLPKTLELKTEVVTEAFENMSEQEEVANEVIEEPHESMHLPSKIFRQPNSLLSYADKQMRKEMFEAVVTGDYKLLENFCETFSKILQSRPEIMINPHLIGTGETILHTALQMDYDKYEIVY